MAIGGSGSASSLRCRRGNAGADAAVSRQWFGKTDVTCWFVGKLGPNCGAGHCQRCVVPGTGNVRMGFRSEPLEYDLCHYQHADRYLVFFMP